MKILLLLLFSPIASSFSHFPIVHTSYGAVRGYEYSTKSGFVGEIFKKIPFAAPPTGARRWKKPEPPEPWNYTIDGTFFGPGCAQVPSSWKGYVTGLSEDCLTLNVYTSRECRQSNATCPVVVYVHGGSALFSGALMFPDEVLVTNYARQGVILVTIAYRVGVFGVMALGDENVLPANLAMHDIVQSLRFVRKEIRAFGGDKDQITLMGHSTGATIVIALVFSPNVNKAGETPLFSRAIAMSSTMNLESEDKQVNRSHVLAAKLGCAGTAQEIVECLRPLSTDRIIAAAQAVGGPDMFSPSHLSGITLAGELMPIHNMRDLREHQMEHMRSIGPGPPTKLLLGSILKEFKMDQGVVDAELDRLNVGTNQALDVLGVRNKDECMEKYYDDLKDGKFNPVYDTLSQAFLMTTTWFASAQARSGAEVYLYQLDYPKHAQHADDLYYIMGVQNHPMDENEEWLSRVYPVYFTNFIKGVPLAPDWSPLNPDLMNYYSVNKSLDDGVVPRMKYGYHQDLNDYYHDMTKFDETVTKIKRKKLNTPIEYKNAVLLSQNSSNFLDIIIYFVSFCVISFIAFKIFERLKRQRKYSRLNGSSLEKLFE